MRSPRRIDLRAVRFAREMRPAAVLIEQVPNFLRTRTATGGHLLEVLRDEFEQLGYDLHVDVLNAQAQRRCAAPAAGAVRVRTGGSILCVPVA